MELHTFIEEFLPDYNEKRITYRHGIDNFLIDYFPEALNLFTDKICKRQRELCVDAVWATQEVSYDEKDEWIIIPQSDAANKVEDAEQPEIYDLLTKK